jgi:DNA-binding response OmpR family regulator
MNKKRILYAEDDVTLAFLTKDGLESYYEVIHCENGQDAIDLFKSQSFDACVLDVVMPFKDGFELAKEIRAINSEIPILFLSAKTLKEDRIKGLKIGADDYLIKPFSLEELQLKLEVFLQRSQKNTLPKTTQVINIGSYTFDSQNFILKNEHFNHQLTEREKDLLLLFSQNTNQVLKREQILKHLWGNDDYFSGRSLDVFISRLRKYFQDDKQVNFENIPRVGFKMIMN